MTATGREAWRRAEVATGFAGSAACKIPFDVRKECQGARQRELINNQEYSVLFSSKCFININESSRAVGEVFKPHSVFTDKEMKALAEGQGFQKQKLLLRAPLAARHQNSRGTDCTFAIVVNGTPISSAKVGLNLQAESNNSC